ncbi:hypothetical protein K440DRAFT_636637 [Wilcoxina mikolae CBS 423.85]|nr:hypothetical protein K440DRAFT_636637 [Wilcoxina mikolae CBS 423.85]
MCENIFSANVREVDQVCSGFLSGEGTTGRQLQALLSSRSYSLETKLVDLIEQQIHFQIVFNSAKQHLQSVENHSARFRSEFKSRIEILERCHNELVPIETLGDRLQAAKETIDDYNTRIQRVQIKTKRNQKTESEKERITWKARLFSGITAILIIIWLLETAGSDEVPNTLPAY